MATKPIRITFQLDESDTAYFRKLYADAKKEAASQDPAKVVEIVRAMIGRVRGLRRVPSFLEEAVSTLEALIGQLEDADWALPKTEAGAITAALAYFANPKDLIPDNVPGLGFLDDAIMISFVAEEFRHELWAYRKFRSFRGGAEQRPWTSVAKVRLPKRLEVYRRELREKVEARKLRDKARAASSGIRKLTL